MKLSVKVNRSIQITEKVNFHRLLKNAPALPLLTGRKRQAGIYGVLLILRGGAASRGRVSVRQSFRFVPTPIEKFSPERPLRSWDRGFDDKGLRFELVLTLETKHTNITREG